MYEGIFSNISRHTKFERSELDYFASLLVSGKIEKKGFLLRTGKLCPTIDYVVSGVVRSYYDNGRNNDSTIMFALKDWWITDIYAFLNKQQSQISIQALQETSVLRLPLPHLELLYKEIPKFERVFRILMQNAYVREQQRVIQNLSMPAKDRYENFLEKYSSIAQAVPQKHIASYLGITPEFLSTLRRKSVAHGS
jgi:CRP-like cAMP-binding protein